MTRNAPGHGGRDSQVWNLGQSQMRAAGRIPGLQRSARILALLALVLYQPLAAIHAATDEAHITGAAPFIHVDHAGHADASGHAPHGHHQPAHDALCDFCLLSGPALAPLPAVNLQGAAWALPRHWMAATDVQPYQWLHVANPVRAPPPTA